MYGLGTKENKSPNKPTKYGLRRNKTAQISDAIRPNGNPFYRMGHHLGFPATLIVCLGFRGTIRPKQAPFARSKLHSPESWAISPNSGQFGLSRDFEQYSLSAGLPFD